MSRNKTKLSKSSLPCLEAQSAILNWLIAGFVMVKQEGMTKPMAVKAAIDSFQYENDKVAQFFEDRMVEDANAEATTSSVYEAYCSWCISNGYRFESIRGFTHELKALYDVKRKRPKGGGEKATFLIGYKLTTPAFL